MGSLARVQGAGAAFAGVGRWVGSAVRGVLTAGAGRNRGFHRTGSGSSRFLLPIMMAEEEDTMTPDAMAVVATLVVGFVALFWQGRDKLSPRFDALDERLRHVEQGIVELRTLLAERLPRRQESAP